MMARSLPNTRAAQANQYGACPDSPGKAPVIRGKSRGPGDGRLIVRGCPGRHQEGL